MREARVRVGAKGSTRIDGNRGCRFTRNAGRQGVLIEISGHCFDCIAIETSAVASDLSSRKANVPWPVPVQILRFCALP